MSVPIIKATGAKVFPIRVAICVPAMDTVMTTFAHDLARMMVHVAVTRPDVSLNLIFNRGSLLPQLRETLVRESLALDVTHVLFLDSDMRFPKDALLQLLAHDLPVVGINYCTRTQPFRPVAQGVIGDENTYLLPETGLEKTGTMGFGCVLVRADVLRKMEEPRFAVGWSPSGKGYAGEDVYFFMKAAEVGFTPVIDHDLSAQCAHTGTFEYTLAHATVYQDEKLKREAANGDHD